MSAAQTGQVAETTYLELSEDGGGAHKFYEVTVQGTSVSVRYGRIGADGQLQQSSFPTPEKARAAAAKKIGEKVRKGYAPAVRGQRAARAVTRRQVTSAPSTARATAPVLWRFRTGASAFGIHVDDDRCWVGNQNGDVYSLAHDGEVLAHYSLPEGVKCLVADDFWIYAGCDDGRVYDLSAKVPFAAYAIADDVDIFWLDIHEGVLNVADRNGGLTVIDHEDEFQWSRNSAGDSAWMVRADDRAVYHGHGTGVTAYAADGTGQLWHTATQGNVLFGWQESDAVYAGTGRRVVQRLAKTDGRVEATYTCDAAVYSCATSPGGEYVFAGDSSSSVYCFRADGTRLWKLSTGGGSALSMQYHEERLYLVSTDGSLACVDASPAAIEAAEAGSVPVAQDIKLAAALPTYVPPASPAAIATVSAAPAPGSGVVVECVQAGGRLRVHVISDGYESGWNVQFPRAIRQAGARYVVDALHSSTRGFYRVRGEIRRLV
ncbi:WGR domain-containing protein [Streptomyces sp. NPDC001941]|uniref:WGR domain-containing protein n=1 Tax=Streptomyces sp. NPDC001941 TaxID=3154659 RepID=UPI00332E8113